MIVSPFAVQVLVEKMLKELLKPLVLVVLYSPDDV